MGSAASHVSRPDQHVMVLIPKPHNTDKLYVSKVSVSRQCEGAVSRRITCHDPLTHIETSGSLVKIGNRRLILPESLEEVGDDCFPDMGRLRGVDLRRSNVWRIGKEAFCRCQKLSGLKLPRTLSEIGNESFASNCSLCDVKLEHTRLRVMERDCFQFCWRLKRVSLPAT
jgi:hypothetical protein